MGFERPLNFIVQTPQSTTLGPKAKRNVKGNQEIKHSVYWNYWIISQKFRIVEFDWNSKSSTVVYSNVLNVFNDHLDIFLHDHRLFFKWKITAIRQFHFDKYLTKNKQRFCFLFIERINKFSVITYCVFWWKFGRWSVIK